MTSGQDLMLELQEKLRLLDAALATYGTRGRAYAEAERDYRVELRKLILTERVNKTPTSIIGDVCRGDPTIAEMKFQRDVAEATYKSAIEAINIYKLQIRVLENQIEREWKNG